MPADFERGSVRAGGITEETDGDFRNGEKKKGRRKAYKLGIFNS